MKVISQMTTRRTRPIYRDLRATFSSSPLAAPTNPGNAQWGRERSRVYHSPFRAQGRSCQQRFTATKFSIDALTSFSLLSNIRRVYWGVQRNGKDLAMFQNDV